VGGVIPQAISFMQSWAPNVEPAALPLPPPLELLHPNVTALAMATMAMLVKILILRCYARLASALNRLLGRAGRVAIANRASVATRRTIPSCGCRARA
jgi:hypothetical protein